MPQDGTLKTLTPKENTPSFSHISYAVESRVYANLLKSLVSRMPIQVLLVSLKSFLNMLNCRNSNNVHFHGLFKTVSDKLFNTQVQPLTSTDCCIQYLNLSLNTLLIMLSIICSYKHQVLFIPLLRIPAITGRCLWWIGWNQQCCTHRILDNLD